MKKDALAIDSQITLNWEETAPCTFNVAVNVPAEAVKSVFAQVVSYMAKGVNVPGFRPGTAPVSLIKSRYKDAIGKDVAEYILSTAFRKITQTPDRDVVGYRLPEDANLKFEDNTAADFTFIISIAPTIALPAYKGVKADVEKEVVDDARIAKRHDEIRQSFADFKTVDTEIKPQDLLKVSYTADVTLPEDAPGSLKAMTKAESTWIWLNQDDRIPGITEAVMGKKTGDEVTFAATFPADAKEPFLADKTLNYTVKVIEVQRREPLTDEKELCARMGVKDMDAFNARVKADLEEEVKSINADKLAQAIREKVIADTPDFAMPGATIDREMGRFMREIIQEVVKTEDQVAAFQADRAKHEEEARKRATKHVRESFIIRAIANAEKIEVTQAEIQEQIDMMARYFGQTAADMRKRIAENGAEEELANSILNRKVSAFLAEQAL